ncbi:MAG: hypothetical protein Q3976_05520 [Corynebacterium sp.]|nr:hypothetical protein [Corynebacterium sp.]
MPFQDQRTPLLRPLGLLACGVLLCFIFKGFGLVTTIIVLIAYLAIHQVEYLSPELDSIRGSIKLSLEDLEQLIAEIQSAPKSEHAEALFHSQLPIEGANVSTRNPALYTLLLEYQHAVQYLQKASTRVDARLKRHQLEKLLQMTDHRVGKLYDAWNECPGKALIAPLEDAGNA